ncbi:hypothetical protein A1E80_RS10660 [Acinetobacter baumannii]|uniref:hypothetical protein n=1 Tax=Acinetobacter calcoaceticus/baumannii complex TaxID=909768 RepID=UPI00099312E8|nr:MULTISPECIES: hypothetical protein [Acinetobacter calcoaceticus/baumannii complex]EHU1747766.1 hypothetical protein [Acinetobacter baumannii]EHU1800848.1 hypothetical protein [Acinetobacter baumannii]EHU1952088.1 hypothetical protein [Acinetobacter baumannii]EKU6713966.1 hypothetical protein [Acinetobacter baumannii]EKV1990736.1 hypothetical protein [Acinetobacter baumannii]
MNRLKILASILFLGIASCSNESEITLPNVSQAGVGSAENIIKAAELQPIKIIDSTDSRDAVKKIYQFDGVFNQLEFSKNYILISWFQHNKTSLDKAVRLGIATLGNDAGYFIHKVDIQGEHTDYSIQGHRISNSTCISKLCAITIQRN